MAVKDYGGKQPIISDVSLANSDGNFVVTVTLEYAGRDGEDAITYKASNGVVEKSSTSNVITFTSSDISAGTTPAITVVATTDSGVVSEAYTPVSLLSFITTPGAPSSLSASVGNGQITVSWSAGDTGGDTNANTVYRVEYSTNGSTWTSAGTVAFGTNSKTITSLTNGTAYYYRVRTENSLYQSSYVQGGSTATPLTTPSAPSISASATTTADPATLTVSWSHVTSLGGDTTANRTYDVQYSTDNATWFNLSTGVTGTSATLGYDVPDDTSASQVYYFRVRTNNSVGSSSYSSSASATAYDEPGAPGTPSLSRLSSGSIYISWTKTGNYGGAAAGNIVTDVYYSTDNATWLYSTSTIGTSSSLSGLSSNTTYYVRLKTFNNNTNTGSNYSASASILVFGTPSTPASISYSHEATGDGGVDTVGETITGQGHVIGDSTSYGNKINISWSASDGAGDSSITYTLQANVNNSGSWSTVTTTSSTSYTHSTTQGSIYEYRVRSNNDVASSGWRTSTTEVQSAGVPGDISNVTLTNTATEGQVTVSWTGGGFGGSSYAPNNYKIYASPTPLTGSSVFTLKAIIPNAANTWSGTISGLDNREWFISVNPWNGYYERSGDGTTITPFFPPYFPPFFPPYFPPYFPPFFPPFFPPSFK